VGFSFYKQIRFGKYFSVNFSKSGMSFGIGVPGVRLNTGPRGVYLNAGLMGFRYRRKLDLKKATFAADPTVFYWLKASTDGSLLHPSSVQPMEKAFTMAHSLSQDVGDREDVLVIAEKLNAQPEVIWRFLNRGGKISVDSTPAIPEWMKAKVVEAPAPAAVGPGAEELAPLLDMAIKAAEKAVGARTVRARAKPKAKAKKGKKE
jgi:hypothetical protein